jgi:hypothetical protein
MQSTKFSAALAARVDGILDAALSEQRIVGAILLVAREGSLVCDRAVGRASARLCVRLKPDPQGTIYRVHRYQLWPYMSG